jgi:hypothetical protein
MIEAPLEETCASFILGSEADVDPDPEPEPEPVPEPVEVREELPRRPLRRMGYFDCTQYVALHDWIQTKIIGTGSSVL